MQIVVLNGSPKGATSVTVQSVLFLQQKFRQHDFLMEHVAQHIDRLERDRTALRALAERVRAASGVLWATPVYYMLVPAQYKRFVELIWEEGLHDAFAGKYAASLTTSIHFFDHMAHRYLQAVSDDLDMRYVAGYAPHMNDLLQEEGREALRHFAGDFFAALQGAAPAEKAYLPPGHPAFAYRPGAATTTTSLEGLRALIVTDARPEDANLARMVDRFRMSFTPPIPVVNLRDVAIDGGCQGCLKCGYDNECAYAGHDGYVDFFKGQIQPAQILIFAGSMRDRYLSARWKLFMDRSFYNGHVPVFEGKQVACLISGPLRQNGDLREHLTAYVELQRAHLAGIVTDEAADSARVDAQLAGLAERVARHARQHYRVAPTFYSSGGNKLLRDFVWGSGRAVFQADHEVYQLIGMYDYPQRNIKARLQTTLMAGLLRVPPIRRRVLRNMREQLIKPHRKVLGTA